MIKLIAALTMLIDHIGFLFFPEDFLYRVIGRLAMPLFAYCVARGYFYSRKHGTFHKYLLNMFVLAVISQIPFSMVSSGKLNICFTWLLSLLLLAVAETQHDSPLKYYIRTSLLYGLVIFLVGLGVFPVEYGIYGIITPLLFYFLITRGKENTTNYFLVLVSGWAIYMLAQRGSAAAIMHIFSVMSAFLLSICKRYDRKVKLPKWAYYTFYPVHLMILLAIHYFIV